MGPFTKHFIKKYGRVPTIQELKDLIYSKIMPDDDRYIIPLNKLEAWAEEKKRFKEYLKNGERKE